MLSKLSISNIAWDTAQDETVYTYMKEYGFTGLEIAPTRIFPELPYEHIKDAVMWAQELKNNYGISISSMQSIWYGRKENIFGTSEEKILLISYTKRAIDFASAIGNGNLVFGCPRNRNIPAGTASRDAVSFFREIAEYAAYKGTVIGMEANPPIYNTNFINDTVSALQLIKEVDSKGFKLNLDLGTMIYNRESVALLKGNVHLINHVHISEPGLKPVKKRPIHSELIRLLIEEGYDRYISIEMGKTESLENVRRIMEYMSGVMCNDL